MIYLLVCHVIGDFLLQNDWMQEKSRNSFVCLVHVLCYLIPFTAFTLAGGMPWAGLAAIGAMHYLQDRYALHLFWMALYKQTMPDKWPLGPFVMDQAWHIAQLAFVARMVGLA